MYIMISYGSKIIDSKKLMEVIKCDFFYNLNDEERFFVVAHHPKLQFNAVIQDNVVPK